MADFGYAKHLIGLPVRQATLGTEHEKTRERRVVLAELEGLLGEADTPRRAESVCCRGVLVLIADVGTIVVVAGASLVVSVGPYPVLSKLLWLLLLLLSAACCRAHHLPWLN